MSTQRKLNALLFELQSARNPLAQAKILARAWRTLRELSSTDLRLLARHAGFDGAQEILEGLADRGGGIAPAMLLQILANARNTDASSVGEVLQAVRDPNRRQEGVARAVDLTTDLLAEPEAEEPVDGFEDALGELQAVESEMEETPEEAIAALTALESDDIIFESDVESQPDSPGNGPDAEPRADEILPGDLDPKPVDPLDLAVEVDSRRPAARSPEVDWSRWDTPVDSDVAAPDPRSGVSVPLPKIGSQTFDTIAVMAALGAEASVLSQLRVLRRELAGFSGSSAETLHRLVMAFPDGWARRRALAALLEAGIPSQIDDALNLIECLDREMDRRWCLGILAHNGRLKGRSIDRGLGLLQSPMARKRVEAAARAS